MSNWSVVWNLQNDNNNGDLQITCIIKGQCDTYQGKNICFCISTSKSLLQVFTVCPICIVHSPVDDKSVDVVI